MVNTIEVYELLKKKFSDTEAEKIVAYIKEQTEKTMAEQSKELLTKSDKIDLINRMDAHFKWLVGIMLSAISLATALSKLL